MRRNETPQLNDDPRNWKPIPGYEGYEASLTGEIRSFRYKGKLIDRPHILTQYIKSSTRGRTRLCKIVCQDGKPRERETMTLIALAYGIEKPKGTVLYHKNGILSDNRPANIGVTTLKKLGAETGHRSRSKGVAKVDQNGYPVKYYRSTREAAKDNFICYQSVSDRCRRVIKKEYLPGGYTFRWSDEIE